MAATTIGGGMRSLLVAEGSFNQRVFADDAPEGCTFPYVTIYDAVTVTRALRGDGDVLMLDRQAQVDLWQRLDEEDNTYDLAVYDSLQGARIDLPGATILHLRVEDAQRIPEQDTNIVRRVFTLAVSHDRAAF